MFLYSSEAMALLGPDITEEQMESFLTAGLALANEAMVNSGIAAEFVPAYFGLVRSKLKGIKPHQYMPRRICVVR